MCDFKNLKSQMSNNGIQMNNQQPTNLGFGNFFGGNVPSINMNGGNQPPQGHVTLHRTQLKNVPRAYLASLNGEFLT